MQTHYGHSSRENATPPSGTSPLAFYKEVTPRTTGENSLSDHSKCEDRVVSYGRWSVMSNTCTDIKLNLNTISKLQDKQWQEIKSSENPRIMTH